jgi:aspartate racemase
MKTLGLLGGMSWESTVPYYQLINQGINRRLGGLHSAKMLLYSVDFYEIEQLQQAGQWDNMAEILSAAAQRLEAGGAEGIVLCTNTMHRVAPQIETRITVPLLHIADAIAAPIKQQGYRCVGLLGTKFTMEQDFYTGRLREKHGIATLTPEPADRQFIHDVIYRELCVGNLVEQSRQEFLRIIINLHERGAEAVVLGCTEIPLLVQQPQTTVPLLDTLRIHAEQAVAWALD